MPLLGIGMKSPFAVAPTEDGRPCLISASVLRMSIYTLRMGEAEKRSSYGESGLKIVSGFLVIEQVK